MSGHNKEEEDYGSKVASDDGSNASEDLVVMRQQGTHAASMRVVGRRGSYLRIQKGIPAASSYSNLKRNQSESKTVSINLGQSMVRVRAPEQIPDRVLQDFDNTIKRQQSIRFRGSSSHLRSSMSRIQQQSPRRVGSAVRRESSMKTPKSVELHVSAGDITQVEESHDASEEITDNICPICFEEEEEGEEKHGWCHVVGCKHRFHTVHILEFLRYWNRYSCPMCNGEIDALKLENGDTLSATSLQRQFYSPPSGVKFNSEHNFSLFSDPDEVQALPLTKTMNEYEKIVQQASFATIRLQLIDSDGRDCGPDGKMISIKATHDLVSAELFNDSATVQSEGQCTFSNLVMQMPEGTTLAGDEKVGLTFTVTGSGEGAELPCHEVVIRASVLFPIDQRETAAGLLRRQSGGASMREPANTRSNSAVDENKSTEPVTSRRTNKPGKQPASGGKDGCGCVIL